MNIRDLQVDVFEHQMPNLEVTEDPAIGSLRERGAGAQPSTSTPAAPSSNAFRISPGWSLPLQSRRIKRMLGG